MLFYQLTNGVDIKIADYKKNKDGKWELIYINPEKCLKIKIIYKEVMYRTYLNNIYINIIRYELYKESVYKKYIGDTKYESKNTIT